MIGLIMCVCVT